MSQAFLDTQAADAEIFLADFGETLTWTPDGGGAGTQFTGIFDDDFKALNIATGMVDSLGPQVLIRTAALPLVKQRDTITRSAKNYTVTSKQPDGTGFTRLLLKG